MNKYISDPELLETSQSGTVIPYINFLKKYNVYEKYDTVEFDVSIFTDDEKLIIKYKKLNDKLIYLFEISLNMRYIIIYDTFDEDKAYLNYVINSVTKKHIIKKINLNNDIVNLEYHRYTGDENVYEYIIENIKFNNIIDIIYEDISIKINLMQFFKNQNIDNSDKDDDEYSDESDDDDN